MPRFYVGAGGSSLQPPVCTASALTHGPLSRPSLFIFDDRGRGCWSPSLRHCRYHDCLASAPCLLSTRWATQRQSLCRLAVFLWFMRLCGAHVFSLPCLTFAASVGNLKILDILASSLQTTVPSLFSSNSRKKNELDIVTLFAKLLDLYKLLVYSSFFLGWGSFSFIHSLSSSVLHSLLHPFLVLQCSSLSPPFPSSLPLPFLIYLKTHAKLN